MSERSETNWMNIALLLVGGYVVIKYVLPLFQTASAGVAAAGNAVSSGIANTYLALTQGPGIQVNTAGRGVNVPGVGVVPLSSFSQLAASADGTYLTGVYGNTDWTISGPVDANGNYSAS